MTYTPTEWETGDTITAASLNKIENGIANAGSSYDLVLTVPYNNMVAQNVQVVSGDILECEEKIADGESVNAILLVTNEFSYTPSTANAPNFNLIAKLTYWHCPYCYMTFSSVEGYGTNNRSFKIEVFNIAYDPDDGSIVGMSHPYTVIS